MKEKLLILFKISLMSLLFSVSVSAETDINITSESVVEGQIETESSNELEQTENIFEPTFKPIDEANEGFIKTLNGRGVTDYLERATFPKTIDYPPMNEPKPSLGEPESISSPEEFIAALKSTSDNSYYLTTNINISDQRTINITKSKEIDLKKFKLTVGNSTMFNITSPHFSIKNGEIEGGNAASAGGDTAASGLIYVPISTYGNNIIIENIEQKSDGVFIKALASNIFFKGNNKITNGYQNARAGNVTFLEGKFEGYVTKNGYSDDNGRGDSVVNISFYGYYEHERYYPIDKFDQYNGSRRVYVTKNADVYLQNTNTTTNTIYLAYTNNVGNFSTMTTEGKFVGESRGTSLRTTASSRTNNGAPYNTRAGSGTYNNRANINVLEDSVFNISSSATNATWGTIYTWATDLYASNPSVFDMRYFGNGNFIRNNSAGDMILYDLDVGVWSKSSQGVGNPIELWQDVIQLNVIGASGTGSGTVSALPASHGINNSTFNVANFSRISNDVTLPEIIPSSTTITNSDLTFSGSTDYYYPDGSKAGKPSVGAEVRLYSGGGKPANNAIPIATVLTDENGNWSFNDFNKKRLPAGEYTLQLTDKDKRTAKDVKITILDKLPPKATAKLYKFKMNTPGALTNPGRDSILDANDETTPKNQIKYEYDFSSSGFNREYITKTPGFYELVVKVTDLAGNTNPVTVPVIVYEEVEPTKYFVSGKNFIVDYDQWVKADNGEKQSIVLDESYGDAKGYLISGNSVTDITTDANQFKVLITQPVGGWEPDKPYDIKLSAGSGTGSYSKTIKVTLDKKNVKMSVKQVYGKDNSKQIYSDLTNEIQLDNSKNIYDAEVGELLLPIIIKQLEDDKKNLKLNYDGYETVEEKDFKVVINGLEVNTDRVPNQNFDLVFEYKGIMNISVSTLDFDEIETTEKDNTIHNPSTKNTNNNKNIEIVNTTLNPDWKLSVSLKDGITTPGETPGSKVEYLGGLYIGDEDNPIEIDADGTVFAKQSITNKKLKTSLPMDIKLYQDVGNILGTYTGELNWTLEDTP